MSSALVWIVSLAAIVAILFRPKGWPEAIWACAGAAVLVASGLLPVSSALHSIAKGTDVYLFLTGMMLLAELARQEGVFDWLAAIAVAAARKSAARLFGLVYVVGILVTAFLSNDATAVVLTPAVYAAVKRARAEPLPYLFICAFIANAASFVLPISNPANLVVYGKDLPPLLDWLKVFLLPSVVSIAITYIALRWMCRKEIGGAPYGETTPVELSREGRWSAWGIVLTGAVLMTASAFGRDLGAPTCAAAAVVVLSATRFRARAVAQIAKGVAWSVLPLVAGLFAIVEALDQHGASTIVAEILRWSAELPTVAGAFVASFGIAALSNLMNNLPSGLLAGAALRLFTAPAHIRDAVLIGVDLGPNLSVTGSLATILWLVVLRREGVRVTAWQFLRIGTVVMTSALSLTILAASISHR